MYRLNPKHNGMYTGVATNKNIKEHCKGVSVYASYSKYKVICLRIAVETEGGVVTLQTNGQMTLGGIIDRLCEMIKN